MYASRARHVAPSALLRVLEKGTKHLWALRSRRAARGRHSLAHSTHARGALYIVAAAGDCGRMSGRAVSLGLVGALCAAITAVGIYPIMIANRDLSRESQARRSALHVR